MNNLSLIRDPELRNSIRSAALRLHQDQGIPYAQAEDAAIQAYGQVSKAGVEAGTPLDVQIAKQAMSLFGEQPAMAAPTPPPRDTTISRQPADMPSSLVETPRWHDQVGAKLGQLTGASFLGGTEHLSAIGSDEVGRIGPVQLAERSLGRAESPTKGPADFQKQATDFLGALAWHAIDSGTFGLMRGLGWAVDKLSGDLIDQNFWTEGWLGKQKNAETTAGNVGLWAGEIGGLFLNPLGIAGKGVQMAGKAAGAASVVAAGGKVARAGEVLSMRGIMETGRKGLELATRGSVRAVRKEALAGAAKGLEGLVDDAARAGVEKAAKSATTEGFWRTYMYGRKYINPQELASNAVKGVAEQTVKDGEKVLREKLTARLLESFGDDAMDLVKPIVDKVAGNFVGAVGKASTGQTPRLMTLAEKAAEKALGAGKLKAIALHPRLARTVDMVATEAAASVAQGMSRRFFEALSEPELYDIDTGDDNPITVFGRALEKAAVGGRGDWSASVLGDIVYGGVWGTGAILKGLGPSWLGKKSTQNWVKDFKNLVLGPKDHDIYKFFGNTVGDVASEAFSRLRTNGHYTSPVKLWRKVAPNLRLAAEEGGLTDKELGHVANNFVKAMRLMGKLPETSGVGDGSGELIKSKFINWLLDEASDPALRAKARAEVVPILEQTLENSLKSYGKLTAKNLGEDVVRSLAVAMPMAFFGGGKELLDAHRRGEASMLNVITHGVFSIMAAADPFWQSPYSWRVKGTEPAWIEDRKQTKWRKKLGEPDRDELPGMSAAAVYGNRLKMLLTVLGAPDAAYAVNSHDRINRAETRLMALSPTHSQLIDSVNQALEQDGWGDRNTQVGSVRRSERARKVKVVDDPIEAATAFARGEDVLTRQEMVAAFHYFNGMSAAGVQVHGALHPDGPVQNIVSKTGENLELDAGLGTREGMREIEGIDESAMATATLAIKRKLVEMGHHNSGQSLSFDSFSRAIAGKEAHELLGKSGKVVSDAASVLHTIVGDQNGGKLGELSIIGGDLDPAVAADLSEKYENLRSMIDGTGRGILTNKRTVIDLDRDGPEKLRQLQELILDTERSLRTVFAADKVGLQNGDLLAVMQNAQSLRNQHFGEMFFLDGVPHNLPNADGHVNGKVIDVRTVTRVLEQFGLIQDAPGHKVVVEPDFKKMTMTDRQQRQLSNLLRLMIQVPGYRLSSTEHFTLDNTTVANMLWNDTLELAHATPDNELKDFTHEGGLIGALEAAGINLDDDSQVAAMMEGMAMRRITPEMKPIADFSRVAEKFGLWGYDPKLGRFSRMPIAFDGNADTATVAKALHAWFTNGHQGDEDGIQLALDEDDWATYVELTRKAKELGFLDTIVSETTDAQHVLLMAGQEGSAMRARLGEAMEVYNDAKNRELYELIGDSYNLIGGAAKGGNPRISQALAINVMDKIKRFHNMGTPWAMRQLIGMLADSGIIKATDQRTGMTKFKLNTEFDAAALDRLDEIVELTGFGDNVEHAIVMRERNGENAESTLQYLRDKASGDKPEGSPNSLLLRDIGMNRAEQIRAIREWLGRAAARTDLSPQEAMRRGLLDAALVARPRGRTRDGRLLSDQAVFESTVGELTDPHLLNLYSAMTDLHQVETIQAGSIPGAGRDEDGVSDGEVVVADYSAKREDRARDFTYDMMQRGGWKIAELDRNHVQGRARNLLLHPDELDYHLDRMWEGGWAYLEEDGNGGKRLATQDPSRQRHFVPIFASDLERILLHELPGADNARQVGEYYRRLGGTVTEQGQYGGDGIFTDADLRRIGNSRLSRTKEVMREYATLLEKEGVTSEQIWHWASTRRLDVQNMYELATMIESFGIDGAVRAFTSKEPIKFLSRWHQVMAKGQRRTDLRLFRAAQEVARTRTRSREWDRGSYGIDTRKGTGRFVVVADEAMHAMIRQTPGWGDTEVTFMDSHVIVAKHLVETVATMYGFDVSSGDYGAFKGSLYGTGLGADGRGAILTKNLFSTDPIFEDLLQANNLAGIISETAAKMLFGDLAGTAEFRLSGDQTTGNLMDVVDDLITRQSGVPTLADPASVRELSLESMRFGTMVHAELEPATVTWQQETWQTPRFINAMARYMHTDKLHADLDILIGRPSAHNLAAVRGYFDQATEGSNEAEDQDTLISMIHDASPLAHAGMLGNERRFLGMVKRKKLENNLFRGVTTAGSKGKVVPDYHGGFRPGEAMVGGQARRIMVDPRHVHVGIDHEYADFDAVDAAVAREFGLPAGHHYNRQAEGGGSAEFADQRRTKWVDYRLSGKGGVVTRGLQELSAMVAKGGQGRHADAAPGRYSAIQRSVIRAAERAHQGGDAGSVGTFTDALQKGYDLVTDAGGGIASWGLIRDKVRRTVASALHGEDSGLLDAMVDEFAFAHRLYWRDGGATNGKVSLGNIHDSLSVIFGWRPEVRVEDSYVSGGSQHFGYNHRQTSRHNDQGRTPVTFGVTTVFQRSPKNRLNDTLISHIIGFHEEGRGNVISMNHLDGVGVAESDYDGDSFNWWVDMPHEALGELAAIRNVSSSLPAVARQQPEDFHWLSPAFQTQANSAYRYAKEQSVAAGQRGQVVKAQRIIHKAVMDQVTLRVDDGHGNKYLVRPKYRSIEELQRHPEEVMRMNQIVQEIIDSKKGMLPPAYRPKALGGEFDPLGTAFDMFYEVVRTDESWSPIARPDGVEDIRQIGGDERQFLKAAMSPFANMLRLAKDTFEGDASRSATWSEMSDIAIGYNRLIENPDLIRSRLEAHILATLEGKTGGKKISVELAHNPTQMERVAREVVYADGILKRRWEQGTGAVVTEMRQDLTIGLLEGHEAGRLLEIVPAFNGNRRELAKIIHEELGRVNNGAGDEMYLKLRQAQLKKLLNEEGEVDPLEQKKPRNGFEANRFMENTIMGYAWKATRSTLGDDDIEMAGLRTKLMGEIAAHYRKRWAQYEQQLASGNPASARRILSPESIEAEITADLFDALDIFQADEEAAILDLISPQEDGTWTHQGSTQIHFRDFPLALLRIAAKLNPDATRTVVAGLVKNQVAITQMFGGDPADFWNVMENSRDSIETASLRRMNKAAFGRMRDDEAVKIAKRIAENRMHNDDVYTDLRAQLVAEGKLSPMDATKKNAKVLDRRMTSFVRSLEMLSKPDEMIAEKVRIEQAIDRLRARRLRQDRRLVELDDGLFSLVGKPLRASADILAATERSERIKVETAEKRRMADEMQKWKDAGRKGDRPQAKSEDDKQAKAAASAQRLVANAIKASAADYLARYEPDSWPAFINEAYRDQVGLNASRRCY